ncbi:MAG: hypothetical protein A3C90_01835 [Candidatus Magasanikbacteria bacterium RIFCSPHIGHO2_02_FULL_51_14]|uniref:DUF5667 domain-containing protein n=1 Tax=Candidatus Magasanikbacteria bacterium RIFCSPHIGHO2_02_FULL_51_14 TaxID=1798683 RepID=A0A1F6MGN6_9BACT|nr:MAG: hypothetical protein A3C90_01835 [Candidatus Magasanikbacteria bacterium RIFCSPHIGHO2_02_FULL_51_14]
MNEKELEQQLNRLPKFRLGRTAVAKFYVRLFLRVAAERMSRIFTARSAVFVKLSATTAFLMLIAIGAGSYAYASPAVTKGDFLYQVKTAIEGARLSFADAPIEKVKAYSAVSLHRLGEAQTMAQEGYTATTNALGFIPVQVASAHEEEQADETDPLAQTIHEMTEAADAAGEYAEDIEDTEQVDRALAILSNLHDKKLVGLEEIAARVDFAAKDAVIDAVALALDTTNERATAVLEAKRELIAARAAGKKKIAVLLKRRMEEKPLDAGSIERARVKIEAVKNELSEQGVPEEDARRIIGRLDARIQKVEAAIADGKTLQAAGLLKSLDALANNARHFLKPPKPPQPRLIDDPRTSTDARVKPSGGDDEMITESDGPSIAEDQATDEKRMLLKPKLPYRDGSVKKDL